MCFMGHMTINFQLDLAILKINIHTRKDASTRHSRVIIKTDTDRLTDASETSPASLSWSVKVLCCHSVYMSNKIQVVSAIKWIKLMIYNGLHEDYIHTMRKCHLRECNMILPSIDTGEH